MVIDLKVLDIQTHSIKNAELLVLSDANRTSSELKFNLLEYKFEGVDVYECFQYFRKILEADGYIIMCNGSRIDSRPSGMLRDMSNGFKVYHLILGQVASIVLDLFEFTDDNLGKAEEQDLFYKKWKASILPKDS